MKIEFDDGSRAISQTLEEASGVLDARGSTVISGDKRPDSCSMDDFYEARLDRLSVWFEKQSATWQRLRVPNYHWHVCCRPAVLLLSMIAIFCLRRR